MEFHPPPLPCDIAAGLPGMFSFFTTTVFFWRPIDVMKTNIECLNSNCPAPSGTCYPLPKLALATSAAVASRRQLIHNSVICGNCQQTASR